MLFHKEYLLGDTCGGIFSFWNNDNDFPKSSSETLDGSKRILQPLKVS